MQDNLVKDALRVAITQAIEELGIGALKATSMFPLTNSRREQDTKAA